MQFNPFKYSIILYSLSMIGQYITLAIPIYLFNNSCTLCVVFIPLAVLFSCITNNNNNNNNNNNLFQTIVHMDKKK